MANLYAIPIIITITAFYLILFKLFWNVNDLKSVLDYNLILYLIVIAAGCFLHEIIHWLTFKTAGKINKADLKFGFQYKTLTPYVHCHVPVTIRIYRLSLWMPFLILGGILVVLSLLLNEFGLFLLSFLFCCLSGGDLLILFMLMNTDKRSLIIDHSSKCGCIVFH
ncbi:MAG: DUF3267 domain-containing protein [Candidatus Cloacimonetes bacterium]|nr:DUF3267 domain-containing protein [Candidatus Cloacimonadota bacterium]